jgi:hypothetical protein
MPGNPNFVLVESSSGETHSLVIGRDEEGRLTISVLAGDGTGAMITLSDEQVAALCAALQEV